MSLCKLSIASPRYSQLCAALTQAHRAGRLRYQQQKGPAWLALNHVLKRMRAGAMACLLEHLPQLIWLALEHSCSLDQQTNWAAVECLHSVFEGLHGMVIIHTLSFQEPAFLLFCSFLRLCPDASQYQLEIIAKMMLCSIRHCNF